ncbi:unnamed protein product [Fraxinus pennsylvanica]|uniref:Uncharacterized protein n=1 Tax=Fraxinus pennsylvanica TaxID=56036 RepID=A0AAD1YUQ5_9LAMI|nr:unnamed protein product [Fraxinus pennsylvanica]
MDKEPRKLVFRSTPVIFLLILSLLYFDLFWANYISFDQWKKSCSNSETIFNSRKVKNETLEEKQNSLDFLFSSLLAGEDQVKLKDTGFACNRAVYSVHCVANQPVRIDTRTMTVYVPSDEPVQETVIKPYARQEDHILLKIVTPVKILHGNTTPPVCQYNHEIPAVIFSSSGFVGNVFHEINEIIIPLYITTKNFQSRVLFVLEDYKPSFLSKYSKVISRLSSYEVMNPAANQSVHCFPGGVVGLKFHGHLSLNTSDVPKGHLMHDLRQFLRQAFNLKFSHVSQIKRPTLMLLSRRTSRRFLNEDEMVAMMEELGFRFLRQAYNLEFSHVSQIKRPTLMLLSRRTSRRFLNEDEMVAMVEELGFRVIVVARAKVVSNLNIFANLIKLVQCIRGSTWCWPNK